MLSPLPYAYNQFQKYSRANSEGRADPLPLPCFPYYKSIILSKNIAGPKLNKGHFYCKSRRTAFMNCLWGKFLIFSKICQYEKLFSWYIGISFASMLTSNSVLCFLQSMASRTNTLSTTKSTSLLSHGYLIITWSSTVAHYLSIQNLLTEKI